ncbi:MAG: hypothetical protein V3W34_14840 [Phycisphaerae bacterium]
MKLRHVLACWVGALCLATLAYLVFGGPTPAAAAGGYEVPSLTGWGKIFSVLLLAALGVAYLVWRRPVLQAQAILETSPLGTGPQSGPLVDWSLYFKTLLGIEAAALIIVGVLSWTGRPLVWVDTWGVFGAGAIVAMVIHLLILARGGDRRDE